MTASRIALAQPWIGPEEQAEVARVLAGGQLASGPVVEQFERATTAANVTTTAPRAAARTVGECTAGV